MAIRKASTTSISETGICSSCPMERATSVKAEIAFSSP
jgi:hypothetical protein